MELCKINYRDTIIHQGVKNQRWGVRHWQNYDGTFNDEGKKRYFGTRNPHEGWRREEPKVNTKPSVQTPSTASKFDDSNKKEFDKEKAKKVATGVLIGVSVAALAYGGYKFGTSETGRKAIESIMRKSSQAGTNIRNNINIQRGRNRLNRQLGMTGSNNRNTNNTNRIHDSLRERSRQIRQENQNGFNHTPEMRELGRSRAQIQGNAIQDQLRSQRNRDINNRSNSNEEHNRRMEELWNEAYNSRRSRNERRNGIDRDRDITRYRLEALNNSFKTAVRSINDSKTNPYVAKDYKKIKDEINKEVANMKSDYKKTVESKKNKK